MNETIVVEGLSNREFFERYAEPARIGIVGGTDWSNRLIRRSERHQHPDKERSAWSHVFLFEGRRADGHHWVIESDLDIRKKHIRLGVQENRVTKYFDDVKYGAVGVIDLGLDSDQQQRLFGCALEHVATGTRFSLREIAATAWALRHPRWRPQENLLVREQSFYCSAFLRHVFSQLGIELAQGVAVKNTTPEDIARTPVPHKKWFMIRPAITRKVRSLPRRLLAKLRPGRRAARSE